MGPPRHMMRATMSSTVMSSSGGGGVISPLTSGSPAGAALLGSAGGGLVGGLILSLILREPDPWRGNPVAAGGGVGPFAARTGAAAAAPWPSSLAGRFSGRREWNLSAAMLGGAPGGGLFGTLPPCLADCGCARLLCIGAGCSIACSILLPRISSMRLLSCSLNSRRISGLPYSPGSGSSAILPLRRGTALQPLGGRGREALRRPLRSGAAPPLAAPWSRRPSCAAAAIPTSARRVDPTVA
mmetsp:Transcript_13993/g.35347  ORF Transcript_13993/g.35347 Transcript_13993/m.35347 type:complete len:241 (-) Transcript_13993:61-783(-)